ncbi:symmetrical bis(5'-nucleosyl)-tetraphosphatase [Solimonas soli]|uniref:symmetrical bis(5'-nucleosyl)-tetraphosphatase n=1 Tax=Solimonas soli TaxID=413479 RepID=UPI000481F65F|nr:symmetrical bis(5'-nucleosyl)-tetraphosphatase [Solimonas soli]
MATYAIGDIQGCLQGLQALLAKLRFRRDDRLLLTGDLVARGPDSLETLRFISALGAQAVSVLGNHDLHLLALAQRGERGDPEDRLGEVLDAPDGDRLLHWLRRQRMAYRDPAHGVLMIHAGLAPQWTQRDTLALAAEVEAVLRDEARCRRFIDGMYGDEPRQWSDQLRGIERTRCTVNILTRARVCDAAGRFDFRYKRGPQDAPDGLLPWFAVPGRRTRRTPVIFGHWSTLGQIRWPSYKVHGLDTGYVWGGRLTALRLDDGALFDVAAGRAAGTPMAALP